jgi:hypothetical protein
MILIEFNIGKTPSFGQISVYFDDIPAKRCHSALMWELTPIFVLEVL